jgi:tritrans,polycis-undecaprenyl-diphosphate synthase [geranylgeranyl-diphosphate specific]
MKYHIGLIPDGNRRWAGTQSLDPWEGHRRGGEKIELFLDWCSENEEVREVSIYLLSEENYKRPAMELQELYRLYESEFERLLSRDKVHKQRLQVRVIATDLGPVPKNLIRLFRRLHEVTAGYDRKRLNLLIGYTGKAEILDSVGSFRNRLRNLFCGLREADIDRGLKVPSPCDLIIRTGEESEEREARSGFLLWQSAYSEYFYIDKLFPEVTIEDFDKAWNHFLSTRRRKGL